MRLYYMTSLQTLENFILPSNRIRVSTFDTVNDPFELLAMGKLSMRQRRDFRWLYEHWVSTLGFISMSETWKSPLMWAHYAENHTGVCLGLDVPDGRPAKVCYEAERLQCALDLSSLETAVDDDIVRTVATTKFKEWEYEQEWRLLLRLAAPDPETKFHYVDFSPEFELREIIVGARCEQPLSTIRNQVFGNTGSIKMSKARPAFQSFSMVHHRPASITISPLHNLRLR